MEEDIQDKMPVGDVSTRWNSTYLMLQRLKEIQQPLSEYLLQRPLITQLTATDWVLMGKVCKILRPFLIFTKEISENTSKVSGMYFFTLNMATIWIWSFFVVVMFV